MEHTEWLQWRHKHIGGSDAPIVMGVSKYKTPLQLYEMKILPEAPAEERNYIQERGQRIEPKIRELFNLMNGKDMKVALQESGAFPFMSVSLDGIDGDEICEIKMASKEDHEGVKAGMVPAHYWPQVQHELAVSGAKRCFYISYHDVDTEITPKNMEVLTVEPNTCYIGELIAAEQAFWDNVQKKKPPVPSIRDYKTLKFAGAAKLANNYKQLKLKLTKLEEELDAAKTELLNIAIDAKHPRLLIGGLKFSQISKIGNVDYKKIPQLAGIDLDQYRGKGSLYWKIDT